ncbi:MAG: hypothetical protein JW993_05945 [Sedimentisphaerales bacterium]|nr:hypothetical protein [Sedimentisphaerales bacterium]
MSDLEQRIEQWRAELAQSQAVAASDINELESHLRDDIAHLQEAGLSEAEAFLVAQHRLGDTSRLAREFRKVNGDRRPLEHLSWMALGVLVYLLVGYVATGLSQGSVLVANLLGVQGYPLGVVALTARAMTFMGLMALLWTVLSSGKCRRPTGFSDRRTARVLVAGQLLSRLAAVPVLGVAEWGRIAYVSNFGRLAWYAVGPILLAVAAIALRTHALRSRRAWADGPSE